jgi:hypothetical protein
MKLFRGILLMLAGLGLAACGAPGFRRPYAEGSRAVRDPAPVERRLESADAASPHLWLGEIGRPGPAGAATPVWRAAYRPFDAGLKRVLLVSGVRGDEPAGPEAAVQLIEALSRSPADLPPCDWDVIPVVNPWGWARNLPYNPDGIDLDGDFASFAAAESRALRRFFREKRYDLAIELREDPKAQGFSLRQYGSGGGREAERIAASVRTAGYPVEPGSGWLPWGPRDGVVDAPLWGLTVLRLTRRIGLAGYLRQNVAPIVFTARTPAGLPEADRVAMLRLAVEGLVSEYGTKR